MKYNKVMKYSKKKTSKQLLKSSLKLKLKNSSKINKTLKTNQSGGLRIGKGGFGCVVKPAIPCKGRNPKKVKSRVSKLIFRNTEDFINELKLYNAIKKIDPEENFFVSYKDICRLQPKDIKKRKDVRHVKFLDTKGKNIEVIDKEKNYDSKVCNIDFKEDPINIVQYFAGISLYKVLEDNSKNISTIRNKFKRNLKNYLKNLLVGLKRLHKGGIVHRDIKEDNIMVKMVEKHSKKLKIKDTDLGVQPSIINSNIVETPSEKSKKLFKVRYIDYGLSDFVKDINDNFYISIKGTPGYISPEVYILKRMLNSYNMYGDQIILNQNIKSKLFITISHEIKNNIGEYFKDIKLTNNIISTSDEKLEGDFNYFYKNGIYSKEELDVLYQKFFLYLKDRKLIRKFLDEEKYEGFIYKIDVFSIGLVFFNIYKSLKIKNAKLLDLIKHMIKLDPEERYSIIKCLKHPFFK